MLPTPTFHASNKKLLLRFLPSGLLRAINNKPLLLLETKFFRSSFIPRRALLPKFIQHQSLFSNQSQHNSLFHPNVEVPAVDVAQLRAIKVNGNTQCFKTKG